ncbi:MAG: hypothetical protein H7328_01310 [Bdellovibrio sp.]|nr:hypothetical protein [Bdellovibrio sp.]
MNKIFPILKKWLIISIALLLFTWIFIFNWSFVFKKKVVGEAVAVERVAGAMAILTTNQAPINSQAFSFSVAIKDRNSGEIFMASSEDRKWAAVTKGNCVVAAYFPYAPWRLFDKGMSDHNARLLRNFTSCDDMPKQDSFLDSIKFFFLID